DLRCPMNESRRRPFEMLLVRLRHVLGLGCVASFSKAACVRRDAIAVEKYFNRRCRYPSFELFVHEAVRRRVEVMVDDDVIVDVERRELPLAVDKALARQGAQRRTLQLIEELATAGTINSHPAIVEIFEQLADSLVEGVDGEECLVTKTRQDP